MTETDTTTGPARDTERDTERHGGRRTRFLIAASAGVAVVLAVSGVVVLRGEDKSVWPRPYDPAQALDISGVPGVSAEQEERARKLVEAANKAAPLWADFEATKAAGWQTTTADGPGARAFAMLTGYEHLVNPAMFHDGHFLDPRHPESLVYKVGGDGSRVFQAYMFTIDPGYGLDHPELTGFAGRLIEWHNHSNACAGNAAVPDTRFVASSCELVLVFDALCRSGAGSADSSMATYAGSCFAPGADGEFGFDTPGVGVVPIGSLSMVHVWVTPNECGPFAAVAVASMPGLTEGVTLVEDKDRVDLCRHD